MLAGVSVEYYSRLERETPPGPLRASWKPLPGPGSTHAERRHLLDLVRTSGATRATRRRTPVPRIRPTIQYVLDAITGTPAIVHDGRLNHVGGNALGKALFAPFFAVGDEHPDSARYTFLDPRAPEFLRDWDKAADDTVAILRAAAGRDPYDRNLSDLIGELSTAAASSALAGPPTTCASTPPARSGSTTPWWATSTLPYESFLMPDQDHNLLVYVAEPGTPSRDALTLLASYAATDGQTHRTEAGQGAAAERTH